jgi:hypothetical protein
MMLNRVSLMRRTKRRLQLACLAAVALLAAPMACETIVDPLSGNGRGAHPRLGDFVMSTVSFQTPDSLPAGDTLVVQLHLSEALACTYVTHAWFATMGVVHIVPYGVRYPGASCPHPRVAVPALGGSPAAQSAGPVKGIVSVPWRIVACRPDADPVWRVIHLQVPWSNTQEYHHAAHWRDTLAADIKGGRTIARDRAVCSTMVKQGI